MEAVVTEEIIARQPREAQAIISLLMARIAELPVGVPQGQSGPRLMAFYRHSKRRTAEFLRTLLGQPCCPAMVVRMQNQVTAALRLSYEGLAAELPTQEPLSIDETPTKEANGKPMIAKLV